MRLSEKAVLLLLLCSSILSCCRGRPSLSDRNEDYRVSDRSRRPRRRRLGQEKDKNDDKRRDTETPSVSPTITAPSLRPTMALSSAFPSSISPAPSLQPSLGVDVSSAAPSLAPTAVTSSDKVTLPPTASPVERAAPTVSLLNFVVTLQEDFTDDTKLLEEALTVYLNTTLTENRNIVQYIQLELVVEALPPPSYEFSTVAALTGSFAANNDGLTGLLQLEQRSLLRDESTVEDFLHDSLSTNDDITIVSIEVGTEAAEAATTRSSQQQSSSLNTALVVGISVAALALMCLVAVVLYLILSGRGCWKSECDEQWVYSEEKEKKIVTVETPKTTALQQEEEEKKQDE